LFCAIILIEELKHRSGQTQSIKLVFIMIKFLSQTKAAISVLYYFFARAHYYNDDSKKKMEKMDEIKIWMEKIATILQDQRLSMDCHGQTANRIGPITRMWW
jgi:hypothetical protein